jgi:cellulose synthase/poly-beta-1,6-N-acetylglucosamine synthase-like glycosyltransferase
MNAPVLSWLAPTLFWLALAVVGYAYAGYPLLAALLSRWRGTEPGSGFGFGLGFGTDDSLPDLTVIVAAHNEQGRIAERVRDILAQNYPPEGIRVIVVSDGSTDGTAEAAAIDDLRVRVLTLHDNAGKAMALNAAAAQADTGILVFTDARQRFGPGALRALVAPFADPRVGGVSGELVIEDADGGQGLYWRMEKALRFDEARLGWLHGVSGAIHALRRPLFKPMPAGTVLDDMWLPLHAVFAGYRIWMARDAIAIDQASSAPGEEFHRKLRTLAGNWQLLARLPALLAPWRNPVLFAWLSHKFLRLLVPWALLVALVASAMATGMFYRVALFAQIAAYLVAIGAWRLPRAAARIPLLSAAGTFLMLNLAALLALPASLAWDSSRLWRKH